MNDLKQHLQALHAELHESRALDPATVEALKLVAEDIRQRLETAEIAEVEGTVQSLSSRLEQLVDEFEQKHPQLTTIVSQLAERLADMGI